MNNLCFHITDITANSIRAQATVIRLTIEIKSGNITIRIADNGCGMDKETLERVRNPFYTTRTTRKVGLGLPFLIQNAEQTGGNVQITSTKGTGTEIIARFVATHIDCPPWGDLPGTIATLISANPGIIIHFTYLTDTHSFSITTEEIREALDGFPLSHPQVTNWLREMVRENVIG